MGARAAGMGTAFIGVADDGSAIYYNPAGIAFQSGTFLEVNVAASVNSTTFTPSSVPQGAVSAAGGYSGQVKPDYIPFASLYVTHSVTPKLTAGFGIFQPFGGQTNFTNFSDGDPASSKFPGRFAGTRRRTEAYWFQPTVAYKINENNAIAIGPAFVHAHFLHETSFLNPQGDAFAFGLRTASTIFPGVPTQQAAGIIARLLPEGRSRLAATGNAVGFAAGYLYKDTKRKTNLGLSYRSATVFHLDGNSSFTFGSQGSPLDTYVGTNFLPNAFPNQKVTATLVLPATYGIGFANSSFWNTTLAVDLRYQDYKRLKDIPINYSANSGTSASVALPAENRLALNFKSSYDLAVGLSKPLNSKTDVRLGYLHSQTPVPDASVGPLFPDADSDSFTVGGTRKIGGLDLTLFYQAEFFEKRTTNVAANAFQYTNGIYDSSAHIFGLSVRLNSKALMFKMH